MKNIFILSLILAFANSIYGQSCTPNVAYTSPGVHPDTVTNLRAACSFESYDESLTFVIPKDTVVNGFNFTINYLQIDSIKGLPAGISYACQPTNCNFPGNTKGCVNFYGTLPAAGTYELVIYLNGTATNNILGTYSITTNYKGYKLRVGEVPVLTTGVTDAACQGNNGTAWVTATGASSYFYYWNTNPPSGNDSIFNLSAGVYEVTVSDVYGCSDKDTAVVNNLGGPVIDSIKITDVLCNGDITGSASVYFSGGNGGNVITWSDGQSTTTAVFLAAGTYSVKIADQLNCEANSPLTITEPTPITALLTVQDVDCFGNANGKIMAVVSGGTPTYSYNWSSGSSVDSVTGGPGIYELEVTDANACKTQFHDTIFEPTAIITNKDLENVLCFGENNGSAEIDVYGGTGTYTYTWNNGDTTAMIQNLSAGTYYVTVSDNNNCVKEDSFTVSEPPVLSINAIVSHEVSGDDGSIDLSVNGGTPPYSYNWNTGDTSKDISGLNSGYYMVTVTDFNGCEAVHYDTVNAPVGILNIKHATLQIYPNPGNGKFRVSTVNSMEGVVSFQVFDLSGKQVIKVETLKTSATWQYDIDLSTFEKGAYLIKVSFDKHYSVSGKFIKTD